LEGVCTSGGEQAACRIDADCVDDLACIDQRVCSAGTYGSPCSVDEDCSTRNGCEPLDDGTEDPLGYCSGLD
jgi:hypothetical protein